ncbi:MAG TPA: DUF2461 domain-containing protein [Streptosporangiaceae bacterium]|jgi:uncharacterized protein (TIGR02453 family)
MTFQGWPAEALEFYEGLEADNTKTYWTANRAAYDKHVLGPLTELLEELAPEFGEIRIFRPYRDLRFSKDKTPYKTHLGGEVGDGYIQLSAEGLAAAHGWYEMASDQLGNYRRAVAADLPGEQLSKIIEAIRADDIEVHSREVLKTAPRGYEPDHPRIELLRYKGLWAWKRWPVEPWLGSSEAGARITAFLRASRPLADWLSTHVGPAAAAPPRRR